MPVPASNFTHYPASAQVTAFEPDPFMLKRAQAAIIEHKLTNIYVRHAAAEALPVHEASFDVVVSTLVLIGAMFVGIPGPLLAVFGMTDPMALTIG